MAWIEKVKNDLVIQTGDSRKYSPSWINATKEKEYNVGLFNFPLLAGTRADRGEPMGTRYILELYFQGVDHLEEAAAFWKSADDKRQWTVYHPFYDVLYVHPISMLQDNSAYNVSKITVPVIETIQDDAPRVNIDPIDTIKLKKIGLDIAFEKSLTAKLKPVDTAALSKDQSKNFKLAVPVIRMPEQLQEYTNIFNIANTAVNNAIQSPLVAIRSTITLLNYPANLSQNIKSRLEVLQDQFAALRGRLTVINSLSAKQLYQTNVGSVISAIAYTSALPFAGDYKSTSEVLSVIDVIIDNYNLFLTDMDFLQSDNGGSPTSFFADPDSLIILRALVFLAVANLFDIAFNARKEYSVLTTEDMNIILLTHRYYGLDRDDINIDEMMIANGIGLNQLLQIKKGTRIVYFK
jgi:hypothetical protein